MHKLFHALYHLLDVNAHFDTTLKLSIDLMHNSFVFSFSEENFKNGHFFYHWFSFRVNVGSEEKLLFSYCISLMSSIEVLLEFGDRNVEIDVLIFMKNSGDDVNENAVSRILVSSQGNFHGSELNSPPDVIINGYFKSDRVPVGSIEHIEKCELVVIHLLVILVAHYVISSEDICQMEDQLLIKINLRLLR